MTVSKRAVSGGFSRNTHQLDFGATLLWQLTFDRPGSPWTAVDVANGTADVYLTRLDVAPMYTLLRCDGRVVGTYTGFETGTAPVARCRSSDRPRRAAHVFPVQPSSSLASFRYYALTVSVGLLTGSTARTLELQEFRPRTTASVARGPSPWWSHRPRPAR